MTAGNAAATPGKPAGNAWKWRLTIVLFVATVLTYLDRATVSLCGPMICDEFHLNNEQFGQLAASFRWAYALTHVPAGFMADRLPIRTTYGLAIGLWSAAGAAAAWVFGFRPLLTTRAILGIGRGLQLALRHAHRGEHVPARRPRAGQRRLQQRGGRRSARCPAGDRAAGRPIRLAGRVPGDWRSGVLLDCPLAGGHAAQRPGFAAVTMGHEQSRTYRAIFALVFLFVGVGAPVAVVLWGGRAFAPLERLLGSALGTSPMLTTWLTGSPLVLLAAVIAWSLVAKGLKSVSFWMLVVVALTVNPCWYFLNDWIPKYMHDQWHLSAQRAGLVTVPIFLGADLGNLLSGAAIKFLTVRGWSLRAARGTTLIVCAAAIGPVALVPLCHSTVVAVLLLGLAGFGITSIVANYTACQQDLSFANVGVVAGFLGLSSNVLLRRGESVHWPLRRYYGELPADLPAHGRVASRERYGYHRF